VAAILNLDFARDQAAQLTRGVPFHADCIEPVKVTIPANLKCPEPNATALLEDALEAYQRYGAACARDKTMHEYGDEPDTRKLFAEVDRLEEIAEAATGVLLFLSRPDVLALMDSNAMQAVAKFSLAVREARS
jgi:hypothetical protein